ncbi:MAG: EF-hand domain-containing protein [bacterium]
MVNGINGGQMPDMQMIQQMMKNHKPEDMFKQMSLDAGGDGKTISKDQLENLAKKIKDSGKGESKEIDGLISNFDKISNGNDKITSKDIEKAVKNGTLKPPKPPEGFSGMGRMDFQDPSTITKSQLEFPIDISI